jgi:hypothetical protein
LEDAVSSRETGSSRSGSIDLERDLTLKESASERALCRGADVDDDVRVGDHLVVEGLLG